MQNTPKIDKFKQMCGSTAPKPRQVYTGDKIIGIATLHKSCAQPVFSQQAAIDISNMRRG